jgi:hypothetical protein
MKKDTFKVFGIITLLVVIGFSFAACGDGSGDNGTTSGSEGTLTITNIPSQYNGKYAAFWVIQSGNHTLMGCKSQDSTSFTLPQISDGRVSIPLWSGSTNKWTDYRYQGNDTFITTGSDGANRVIVKFVSNEIIPVYQSMNEPGDAVFFSSITFSSGSATKSYKDKM